ncbi:MAG: DUF1501 domain-containing protein [Phycisphaerae bacterium]|nr:DUF1501 domain-containing protein [Phycisphaerae bacterium]
MRRRKNIQPRGVSRREFLRVGTAGLAGLAAADWLISPLLAASPATQPAAPAVKARAKSVILLWLGGGPPQTDTFDPKPDAGEDYCGPYRRPIATNVTGIRICETMPRMAKQADKYSIIRSMTHPSNGHETATYIMMTGTLPSADLCYPSIGAVVALKRKEAGYKGTLPPDISLTSPLGRFSEQGFLGNDYRTYATGGDPNNKDFRAQGLALPRGVSDARATTRRDLLETIDAAGGDSGDASLTELESFQQRGYQRLGGEAKKAFDLSAEKDDLRDRYGRNHFGQCCLLARRLVENGVPFVTINSGGWDTHKDHFPAMKRLLPVLDGGFATLLEDLAQHGLLETTIVVCYGEFGRTPKVANEPPWFGGRHHFCNCFSAVVAGGGFSGGKVVGSSDFRGENVRERPVYPWDLSGSIYRLMGIDPHGRLPHPQGRTTYVTPLGAGNVQSGGLLTEIM